MAWLGLGMQDAGFWAVSWDGFADSWFGTRVKRLVFQTTVRYNRASCLGSGWEMHECVE